MAFPRSEHVEDSGTFGQETVLRIPWAGPLTYDNIQGFAEDGHRYELYNGMLIVNASPNFAHQRALKNLLLSFDRALPAGWECLPSPFDWRIDEHTSFEPDIVVVRHEDVELDRNHVVVPPVLAVEILSPSTRYYDLGFKRMAYAEFGLGHLWFVDVEIPKITALALDREARAYVEVAVAVGEQELTVDEPFSVAAIPAQLVA